MVAVRGWEAEAMEEAQTVVRLSQARAGVRLSVEPGSPAAWKREQGHVCGSAAAVVEEAPDCDVELVGSFDVAEMTSVRQDNEP